MASDPRDPNGPPLPPTEPLRPSRPAEPVRPVPPRRAPVVPAERVYEREVPPPLPPESRWSDGAGPAVLAAVVALLVGGVIGYAIGHKGESRTTTERSTPAQTITQTHTVTQPKVIEHSQTVTSPADKANEEKRVEAETDVRRLERENEELKRQSESG